MNTRLKIAVILLTAFMGFSTGYSTSVKQTGKVYVLCYHTWLGKRGIGTDFSKRAFEKQIKKMKNLGYRFVSFQDIRAGKISGGTNILITIDDGNRSVKKVYKSVFKKYGISPCMFIYTCITSRIFYSLKYSNLKKYHDDGCVIGGHGYYHEHINKHLYRKRKKAFKQELKRPKRMLEKKLDIVVDTFAYPYGDYSDVTIEYLEKYGYKYAFKLGEEPMKLPLSLQNAYELPRYLMTKGNWHVLLRDLKKNIKRIKASKLAK